MTEITILCPTGHLGFTPLEKDSFLAGCELKPDFIIADSGSCDIGPYPLGADGNISFKVAKRSSVNEKPKVTINTNIPFKLTLIWGDGESVEKEVAVGNNAI